MEAPVRGNVLSRKEGEKQSGKHDRKEQEPSVTICDESKKELDTD
jgi:hypothetical protein